MEDPFIEVPLSGPGPFLLPLCGPKVAMRLGEKIAVLELATLQGQRIEIPVPLAALAELALSAVECLELIRHSAPEPQ